MSRQERLDKLLRDWAEDQKLTEAEAQTLAGRVAAGLERERGTCDALPRPRVEQRAWARMEGWLAAAAAAAALVAILLVRPWDGLPPPKVRGPEAAFAAAELPEQQILARARLLRETEWLFDGRLAWWAEVGADVERQVKMGLDEEPRAAGPSVAVRLVVARRDASDGPWTTLWSADVVARNEEVVRLGNCNGGDAGRLLLWAYVLPDGMIAVDTDFALGGPQPVQAVASQVQAERVPAVVQSVTREGIEYRVFQTVAVLNGKLG
jgi:hypothetical protein